MEVEAYKGELALLRRVYKSYKHLMAEHIPNTYFISGESGEKDQNDLPKQIHVCPAYGVDWFQVYERTNNTWGPEW